MQAILIFPVVAVSNSMSEMEEKYGVRERANGLLAFQNENPKSIILVVAVYKHDKDWHERALEHCPSSTHTGFHRKPLERDLSSDNASGICRHKFCVACCTS